MAAPGDRAGEPVAGLDELVLRPLVGIERDPETSRCHARSMRSGGLLRHWNGMSRFRAAAALR
jgi:hypothetical protein